MRTFNENDKQFLVMLSFCAEIRSLLDGCQDKLYRGLPNIDGYETGIYSELKDFQRQKFEYAFEFYKRRYCANQMMFLESIEPEIIKLANQRNTLREKLRAYVVWMRAYAPDSLPSCFFRGKSSFEFKDLSAKSVLTPLVAPYVDVGLQKNIFEKKIYCHDQVVSPQIITAILQNGLWAAFGMSDRNFDQLALSFALLTAVSDGELAHVEILLALGARSDNLVNAEGQTTLHLAMKHPVALLKLLLQDKTVDVDRRDGKNMTALEVAHVYQNVEAIAHLNLYCAHLPKDEAERKALRELFMLSIQQKELMSENANNFAASLHALHLAEISEEQALSKLLSENEFRKNAVLQQSQALILERENFVLQGEEVLLQAYRAKLKTALLEVEAIATNENAALEKAKTVLAEEKERSLREAALRERQRAESQLALQTEYTQERILVRNKLYRELLGYGIKLTKKIDQFFYDKKEIRKAELALVDEMLVLLQETRKSNDAKHAELSNLLGTPAYAVIKNPSTIYCLIERVLKFFSEAPCSVVVGVPVEVAPRYQGLSLFPPIPPAGLPSVSQARSRIYEEPVVFGSPSK